MQSDTTTRVGGQATLKIYDAVMGYTETPVRKFTVGEVEPYAQHDRSVRISVVEPRKRNGWSTVITPDRNSKFVTIEVGGKTVYDSRVDIPCDMDEWKVTHSRFTGENRPFRTRHIALDGSVISDSANDPGPEPPAAP